ncbi:TIGR03862 family flavoprotein [Chromobacterium haemolyticum]|uniref:TIGR03862 family flavoprotein n=1 Tax=Chromobacterium haemolyticum TaxID=394935 RepID=UPI0040576038
MGDTSGRRVAIIGGGPAGLAAAEQLAAAGVRVDVYDAMPSVGRKFLLAGVGGMNITHSEPHASFVQRYGARSAELRPMLDVFNGEHVRAWVHGLGIETFIGSSGKVFPKEMKAAPLLRSWLTRLREAGVSFHVRHRFLGWDERGRLRLSAPDGERLAEADAVVLAMGGGSWRKLGSDGSWAAMLRERGVEVSKLQPSNCGFDAGWSEYFADKFAGAPLKSVTLQFHPAVGHPFSRRGEFVVTAGGVEGNLIYACSGAIRDEIARSGAALCYLDLMPDWSLQRILGEVARPRGSRSMSSHLQSRLGLKGVRMGLLRECLDKEVFNDPAKLAEGIKALPLRLLAPRPLDEAISTAGGVTFGALDENLMLQAMPGVFCAGEMLDWEAPTGGYLLTACFSTGRAAAGGVLRWMKQG